MATTTQVLADPTDGSGSITSTSLRSTGIGLAFIAAGAATIAFAGALSAAQVTADGGAAQDVATLGLWTFGLTTAAFGTAKTGIASILLAIVRRIWARVDSVAVALPRLMASGAPGESRLAGEFDSPFGRAVASERAPEPLLIHRIAGLM